MANERVTRDIIINYTESNAEVVKDTIKTIDRMIQNRQLNRYWKDQNALINDVTNSYEKYNKTLNKMDATELVKSFNALKALSGIKELDISQLLPNFDKVEGKVKELIKSIDLNEAFGVDAFSSAFKVFDMLKAGGIDLQDFFKRFDLDIDTQNLQKSLRLAEEEIQRVKNKLVEKDMKIDSLISGSGFEKQEAELESLRNKLKEVYESAEMTFNNFLYANNIDPYSQDGLYEYFQKIKDGAWTAEQAISEFKAKETHLLQESYNKSGGLFNLQQVQEFEGKLESVLHRVEEISRQMNDIVENGVMTKAMQNLSVDDTISQSQRDLFANVLKDEEALSSIAGVLKKIIDESVTLQGVNNKTFDEEQFNRLLILFEKIESSLSSMKAVFVDVGDGEEFSPLLKMIDNVQSSVKELSTSVSGIKLDVNMDLGSEVNERMNQKVSQTMNRQLEAYRNLFAAMKSTGKTNKEMLRFFEPDDASISEIIGAYKGMIKRAEEQFGKDIYKNKIGKDTYSAYVKEIKNATDQFNRATNKKNTENPLGDLFGKNELIEVVSQLGLIADRLSEISSTVSGLGDTFKNVFKEGFNVSASVEEIEKLTSRVKELEDELSKVKVSSTSPVETNISSGNSDKINNESVDAGYISDTKNNIIKWYRTVNDTITGLFSEGRTGSFFSDNLELSRGYADYNAKTYEAAIKLTDKLLELNGKGKANWDSLSYLGFGTDEDSKEIIELANQFQKIYGNINNLKKDGDSLFGSNSFFAISSEAKKGIESAKSIEDVVEQFKQIQQLSKMGLMPNSLPDFDLTDENDVKRLENILQDFYNIEKVVKRIKEINMDVNNLYGMTLPEEYYNNHVNANDDSARLTTNRMTDKASKAGYDAVLFKDIHDSAKEETGRIVSSILSVINNSIVDKVNVLSNDEIDKRLGNDFLEHIVQNTDEFQNNIQKSLREVLTSYMGAGEDISKEIDNIIKNVMSGYKGHIAEELHTEVNSFDDLLDRISREVTKSTIDEYIPGKSITQEFKAQMTETYEEIVRGINQSMQSSTPPIEDTFQGQTPEIDKTTNSVNELVEAEKELVEASKQVQKIDLSNLGHTDNSQPANVEKYQQSTTRAPKNSKLLSPDAKLELGTELKRLQTEIIASIDSSTSFIKEVTDFYDSHNNLVRTQMKVLDKNNSMKTYTTSYNVDKNGNANVWTSHITNKKFVDESKELLTIQKQITKEIEKQEKAQASAQKKKWQAFENEQKKYTSDQKKTADIEKNKSAYQELLGTIKQYSEVSKRIAKNETLDGDLELAQKLENKISELQKNPILSSSQIAKSERDLVNLFNQLDTLERKTAKQDKQSTQLKVDKALVSQLSAWKSIHDIRRQIAETDEKDTAKLQALNEEKKGYWKQYREAEKVLKANEDLYDKESQLAKLEYTRLETNEKINKIKLNNVDIGGVLSKGDSDLKKFEAKAHQSEEYRTNVEKLKQSIGELRTLEQSMVKSKLLPDGEAQKFNEAVASIEEYTNAIKNMPAVEKGSDEGSRTKLANRIHEYMDKNTRMTREFREEFENLIRVLRAGDDSVNIKDIARQFEDVKFRVKEAKLEGKSFFDILKDKAIYGYAAKLANYYLSFYDWIRYTRYAINALVELDSALLDLKKTTSMTENQLEDFYYASNDVAKQMGVTTASIIEQASAWSRLGYSSQEAATKMAQLSSQFASISPGMETDQAQEGLVSIMKAWDIDPDDVKSEIMDNINILGNSFAESNSDLVEGMKRSAAALSAVGTDYKDAFALFTGAQEVLQNAEVTGRALRSISMRIRGYSESSEDGFEELDDELKTVTGDLIDLTKTAEHSQGVSIFKEGSTTEFKSLVDYFGEISDIWDEMTQVQQNDFLQKAFGKTQANLCLYVQRCA